MTSKTELKHRDNNFRSRLLKIFESYKIDE